MPEPHLRAPVTPLGNPGLTELGDRVLTAQIAAGPLGAGGTLHIDPDRAQECIHGLKRAVATIEDALTHVDLMSFPPPGMDPVSVNLAEQAKIMAQRAERYAKQWRLQIVDTIAELEAQLAAYQHHEDELRVRFT